MILTQHGIGSLVTGGGGGTESTMWTKNNVPTGLETLHDFKDGQGLVPAVPYDNASVTNDVTSIKVISYFGTDNASFTNDVIDIQEIV